MSKTKLQKSNEQHLSKWKERLNELRDQDPPDYIAIQEARKAVEYYEKESTEKQTVVTRVADAGKNNQSILQTSMVRKKVYKKDSGSEQSREIKKTVADKIAESTGDVPEPETLNI